MFVCILHIIFKFNSVYISFKTKLLNMYYALKLVVVNSLSIQNYSIKIPRPLKLSGLYKTFNICGGGGSNAWGYPQWGKVGHWPHPDEANFIDILNFNKQYLGRFSLNLRRNEMKISVNKKIIIFYYLLSFSSSS